MGTSVWYCCNCSYGPNNLTLDEHCPHCLVLRCGNCRTQNVKQRKSRKNVELPGPKSPERRQNVVTEAATSTPAQPLINDALTGQSLAADKPSTSQTEPLSTLFRQQPQIIELETTRTLSVDQFPVDKSPDLLSVKSKSTPKPSRSGPENNAEVLPVMKDDGLQPAPPNTGPKAVYDNMSKGAAEVNRFSDDASHLDMIHEDTLRVDDSSSDTVLDNSVDEELLQDDRGSELDLGAESDLDEFHKDDHSFEEVKAAKTGGLSYFRSLRRPFRYIRITFRAFYRGIRSWLGRILDNEIVGLGSGDEMAGFQALRRFHIRLSDADVSIILQLCDEVWHSEVSDAGGQRQDGRQSSSAPDNTSQGSADRYASQSQKRSRSGFDDHYGRDHEDSDDDGFERNPRHSKTPRSDDFERYTVRNLACPFHKLNPYIYSECATVKIRNISVFGTHIRTCHTGGYFCEGCQMTFNCETHRNHYISQGSCPSSVKGGKRQAQQFCCTECSKIFCTGTELAAHQDGSCRPTPGPPADTILPISRKQNTDIVARWYWAWSKLFPTTAKPENPWLDQGDLLEQILLSYNSLPPHKKRIEKDVLSFWKILPPDHLPNLRQGLSGEINPRPPNVHSCIEAFPCLAEKTQTPAYQQEEGSTSDVNTQTNTSHNQGAEEGSATPSEELRCLDPFKEMWQELQEAVRSVSEPMHNFSSVTSIENSSLGKSDHAPNFGSALVRPPTNDLSQTAQLQDADSLLDFPAPFFEVSNDEFASLIEASFSTPAATLSYESCPFEQNT
ncbi:hypothetical protein F5Y16DRAFT_357909 [Xylariaceae sp. FL0255]|nr:hypothetical protein F5Y16DRAFT_357909 [Xylariaceae sp. FL0255]